MHAEELREENRLMFLLKRSHSTFFQINKVELDNYSQHTWRYLMPRWCAAAQRLKNTALDIAAVHLHSLTFLSSRARPRSACPSSTWATPSWGAASWDWRTPWPTLGWSSSCKFFFLFCVCHTKRLIITTYQPHNGITVTKWQLADVAACDSLFLPLPAGSRVTRQ